MRIFTFSLIFLMSIILLTAVVTADEGMWPLYDLDKIDFESLKARGLTLTQDQIINEDGGGIASAVVRLGATASFVSAEGLIVTNHHVAFGAVQKQSSVENNLIDSGFYAATKADEIPAIGYHAYVSLSSEDVTDKIRSQVSEKLTGIERYKATEKAIKALVKEAEKDRDVKCSVSKMFGGTKYVLYTNMDVKDIRIVYIPPDMIGAFGGDIDNWMWPRHCGDFSFLRAYVAPDGSTAEYAEENVPFQPKSFLEISSAGVKEGDFTMMIGFPGRTNRYASVFEMDHLINHYYPMRIQTYEDVLSIIERLSEADSSVAIRLASYDGGINNGLKKSYGLIAGFKQSDILAAKTKTENELKAYINSNPDARKKYGAVFKEIEDLYAEEIKTEVRDNILSWMSRSSDLLSMANRLYKWSLQKEKKDMDRDRGYQNRDTARFVKGLEDAQINLVLVCDREMMRHFLLKAIALPEDQQIKAIQSIFATATDGGSERHVDSYLDALFSKTQMGTVENRLKMFDMSNDELMKLGDPMIALAAALYPELEANRERDKEFYGTYEILKPKLIAAHAEWKDYNLYPDANGTKRFNYGEVKCYVPRDGVMYTCLTGLDGLMAKETGVFPFIIPDAIKVAYAEKDYGPYVDKVTGDVPIDILTTNDGTGGNSGSPVLNGKGELIGLDFDSNYEGVAADYLYDPALARSIVVDIRYVLYIIDKVYHHNELLEELTIN